MTADKVISIPALIDQERRPMDIMGIRDVNNSNQKEEKRRHEEKGAEKEDDEQVDRITVRRKDDIHDQVSL